MIAVASVVVVVLVSLLITRVATVALVLTGLSRESARFQARSALSGVGFTTSEAEGVVNHPIRRRIVMFLMLVGSAGIVTVLGTLFLSFANADTGQKEERAAVLIAAVFAVWVLARSEWVDRRLSVLIAWVLARLTELDVRDYLALLHLSAGYAVLEMPVDEGDWLAGRTLTELRLREEGAVILGINRPDGRYIGAPHFGTTIRAGDTLLVYGRARELAELDRRPAGPEGDEAHDRAVERHRALQDEGVSEAAEKVAATSPSKRRRTTRGAS